MRKFVLNRNYIHRSLLGHSVRFEKGVPVPVPRELEKEVVAFGAECVEGEVDVLGPEFVQEVELTPDERKIKLFDAFKVIMGRDEREDFTAQGLPSAKVVKQLVGFSVERAEIDEAWDEYRS